MNLPSYFDSIICHYNYINVIAGLGLSAEYLSARTLPDLQQPPSTLTSTEFLLGADGEFNNSLFLFSLFTANQMINALSIFERD